MLSRTSWSDRPARTFLSLANWLCDCAERSAQRRALAGLDADRLRDIGRTRAQALTEAAKPFWRR